MNEAKINALCAKARGWHGDSVAIAVWLDAEGYTVAIKKDYDPFHNTNQSLSLLEHVADSLPIYAECINAIEIGQYRDKTWYSHLYNHQGTRGHKTLSEAITICALKNSPAISDAELSEALKEN